VKATLGSVSCAPEEQRTRTRSRMYPLNEADIPPCRRDSASLRPIGTQDAWYAFVAHKGCSLSRSTL